MLYRTEQRLPAGEAQALACAIIEEAAEGSAREAGEGVAELPSERVGADDHRLPLEPHRERERGGNVLAETKPEVNGDRGKA